MPTRAIALFALLSTAAACGDRDAPGPDTAARAPAVGTAWHSLGTWTDRGSRQTESFDVTTGSLRLAWRTTGSASAPFRVSLYSAISGRPLQTIVDTIGSGSDSVRVAIEPHVAYLQIDSEGMEWSVTLEEAVAGGVGGAAGR